MLIKALCDYADMQASEGKGQLPDGWSQQDIHFRIMLTPDGDVADIVDVRKEEKFVDRRGKEKIQLNAEKAILPKRTQKTGIESNIIEHRPLYIFGLNYENGNFTVEDRTDKAKKSHSAFVKENQAFFEGLDSEICVAYRNFVEKWKPDEEAQNRNLLALGKKYQGAYFGFALNGFKGKLEEDEQFCNRYNEYLNEKKIDKNASENENQVCGILGEKLPVARLHDKIKFPSGQTSGCQMVCMNDSAFESYGKTQSFNSNVSELAMKKYTSVLNQLFADKGHNIKIGDMVVVYFAMKKNDVAECDFFTSLLSGGIEKEEQALDKLFTFAAGGGVTPLTEAGVDTDVIFYVAGMTPNGPRISQKFVYRDKFGSLIENLVQHQKDLHINPENKHQIFFSRLAKELTAPKSSNDKVSPPLMTGIMLAAFHGTDYPVSLLETVVRRVKTDSDEEKNHYIKLNDTRAGIIKACINRRLRIRKQKEEITMSLNVENNNPAYLCGRLFAVYEKIQQDSSDGKLNRTIKDSYFSSACARPSVIMTKLSSLAQNHLRKLSEGSYVFYNKLISEIMDKLNGEFPRTLDLDSQGMFIIGYYQQNKELFTAKNTD